MKEVLKAIAIEMLVRNRFQPRLDPEEANLDELACSIEEAGGLIHPVVVRPRGSRYEIVAGERRFLACCKLGYQAIQCIVKSELDDRTSAELSLDENLQRESLSTIEEARSYQLLHKTFGLSHGVIGKRYSRSRTYVTNLIRLLDLDKEVQRLVHVGLFSVAHARALLSLPEAMQLPTARMAMHRGWSSKRLERQVQDILATKRGEGGLDRQECKNPDLSYLERALSQQTSSPVEVNFDERNRAGKVVFNFCSLDEAQGLVERFLGSDWEDRSAS